MAYCITRTRGPFDGKAVPNVADDEDVLGSQGRDSMVERIKCGGSTGGSVVGYHPFRIRLMHTTS